MSIHADAYRQADFINLSISNGKRIVRDVAIVVIIVLGLTLLRFRTILITLLVLPLAVTTGLLLFPKFGLGINIMTLGGLAIVLSDVVDNAIIFIEIAWRKLDANSRLPIEQQQTKITVLQHASAEVLKPVMTSTTIIVLVFLPLLFLSGLEGQFFRPLGLAYLTVFIASLVVALTVTPALCVVLWRSRETTPPFGHPSTGGELKTTPSSLRDATPPQEGN